MGQNNAILLSISALALCGVTAWAARTMLRLAFKSAGETRNWWLGSGSLVIGFGLWDAQIMALLAATQSADANFLFAPTIISLFAALLGTWLSLIILRQVQGRVCALLCGAGMGLTQSCVHYLGLSALSVQYDYSRLDQLLLVAALASNVGLAALAMLAMTRRRSTVLLGNVGSWLLAMGAVIGHLCRTAAVDARAGSTPTQIVDMVNAPALDQAFATGVVALVALGLSGCLGVLLILKRRKDLVEARRLRELKLFMRNVTGAAIYMLDPEGRVKTWNKGAQMLKQYSAEEIIGQHFSRFYPPDLREQGVPARALQ